MNQQNLLDIEEKIKTQRKDASRKMNQKFRKFLTIQVLRKDLNPYITPPKSKKKYSHNVYKYNPKDPKPNKSSNVIRKRALSCDYLPPIKMKDKREDVLNDYLQDILTHRSKSDTARKEKNEHGLQMITEENTILDGTISKTHSSIMLPKLLSNSLTIQQSKPNELYRDVTRAEFKRLRSKFHDVKKLMLETHPSKQMETYPDVLHLSLTEPRLEKHTKLPPLSNSVQIESHQHISVIKGKKRCKSTNCIHHLPQEHNCDSYNKLIDNISLELPSHVTEKLNRFKEMIVDTEKIDKFKKRLLAENRELTRKSATDDGRWKDFEDTMKKEPIKLMKYRQIEKAESVKEEPYQHKLRLFSGMNWMG